MTVANVSADSPRPSPEALLRTATAVGRGRLKIFLGAAPGVGKTFEMLSAARAKRREGVDVVIGIVETHGRAETAALLEGLEVVPRRKIDFAGHSFDEMDLDAILARHPALVLVDELAHTNASGSRHPKRYLDVQELIGAGIDVYTTLNIQHVESLNDVVAQITRIRVRETVPDAILDLADDIEVVDLAPGDLIQRLQEGKVYVPQQAERALEHYFSPGNLTALRELALRRTAQRVDEQLLTHMQAHAIAGPWAAGERVLVCVSEDPRSAGLVRYAKRMADRLHAPWTALSIENARSRQLSEVARNRIAEYLRLAERLGGEAMTIPGGNRTADDIVAFAHAQNVTQIVMGKSTRSLWFEMLHGSVVHDLVRRSGAIGVHVVAGEVVPGEAPAKREAGPKGEGFSLLPYGGASGAVAVALGIGLLVQPFGGVASIDLLFLTSIVAVASLYGLLPSLFACVIASLAYNFFFIPPLYTFTIADPNNVTALIFFLVIAVIVSNLAARARTQLIVARDRARTTAALYAFSRKIAATITLDDLLWAAAYQVASMLRVDVVMLLPEDGVLTVKVGYPPEDRIDEADIAAAKWAFDSNQPAGRGAETLPGARRLFMPLRTGRGAVGVVGIGGERPGRLSPDERRLLDALLDQIAVAIERIGLAGDMDKARLAAETERLRSSLLASLSHDLKTPLAGILGAASSLRQYGELYRSEERADLARTIEGEAERLNRFIANLLDMTRLESGPILLNRQPVDVAEVIGTALARAGEQLKDHTVQTRYASDLPMLELDPVLFEQVVFNLLDNAGKYTPPGTLITIETRCARDVFTIRVVDEGPGIPEAELDLVFEKFHRIGEGDRRPPGTGLGLAICRGFVEALGGTISATNRTDRSGAILEIAFPGRLAAPRFPVEEAAA